MEFITQQLGSFQELAIMVLGVLFVFTVVVFIHEYGHFIVARWCGVKVNTFSIGFGPEIFGWNDRHGTRWRFAWIPLGGYVKFIDDENAASMPSRDALEGMEPEERRHTFQSKSVGQRAAVVAAGPIANFLLAIAIFAAMYAIIGQPSTQARVDEVVAGGPAAEAGFEPGDIIISIEGTEIERFSDLQRIVMTSAGQKLEMVVRRGDRLITLTPTPRRETRTDRFGNEVEVGLIGIQRSTDPANWEYVRYDPLTAVVKGTERTWFVISHTMSYLGGVFAGTEKANQLGGPIKIAQIAGQAASVSFAFLLQIAALISISLGLINLFPIPVLDGGHLLFYAIEAIRGQPLSERVQEIGFRIGLALILMLMIVVTWKDVFELTSR